MQNHRMEHAGIGARLMNPVVLGFIIIVLVVLFCLHIYTLGQGPPALPASPKTTVHAEMARIGQKTVVSYPVLYPESGRPGTPLSHPPY